MKEYLIIRKESIDKIDSLIKQANAGKTIPSVNSQMAKELIKFKKYLLNNSIPLIPQLESMFQDGINYEKKRNTLKERLKRIIRNF